MYIDIFNEKYNAVLNPYAFESFQHLAIFIKKQNEDISFKKLKIITIEIFNFLLENNIIYVLEHDWMNNKKYDKISLSNEEVLHRINEKWIQTISFEEFYNLFWFKYKDWYSQALEEKGLTYTTIDWETFIKEKIGDLEQWIEDNRPK